MTTHQWIFVILAIVALFASVYLVHIGRYRKMTMCLACALVALGIAYAVGPSKQKEAAPLSPLGTVAQKLLRGESVTADELIINLLGGVHLAARDELGLTEEQGRQFLYPSNVLIRLGTAPTNFTPRRVANK
jgi:hypothetical protein